MISKTNNMLKQIASFTSLRDQELLAFSLLQSVTSILAPKNKAVVKLSLTGKILNQIYFSDGDCQKLNADESLDEEWRSFFNYMQDSAIESHRFRKKVGVTYVYSINHSKNYNQYLVIDLSQNMTVEQSHMLSGMLNIFNNFNDLLTDSQTDELTGLLNRKTFEKSILSFHLEPEQSEPFKGNEQRKSQTDDESSNWIVIVDVDHFKSINDKFGHLYGDEVLIHIANALKINIRHKDIVFRFGGEEFVVFFKNLTRKKCEEALSRLSKAISDVSLVQLDNLTVSFGVTKFNPSIFHTTLMDYADQALYYSKENGRNRYTFFEDLIESGLAKPEHISFGSIDYF
jgi:diguanylate cyclase (GGDEF)-like protein